MVIHIETTGSCSESPFTKDAMLSEFSAPVSEEDQIMAPSSEAFPASSYMLFLRYSLAPRKPNLPPGMIISASSLCSLDRSTAYLHIALLAP